MNREAKVQLGGRASIAWAIVMLYQFATNEPGLISWQAPVVMIIGMFIAALVLGPLLFVFQTGLVTLLSVRNSVTMTEDGLTTNIKIIGLVWILCSWTICALVAYFIFDLLF
jgi:hypothetical protein